MLEFRSDEKDDMLKGMIRNGIMIYFSKSGSLKFLSNAELHDWCAINQF